MYTVLSAIVCNFWILTLRLMLVLGFIEYIKGCSGMFCVLNYQEFTYKSDALTLKDLVTRGAVRKV